MGDSKGELQPECDPKSFFTDKKYKDRDELINWVRSVALKVGFTIVISKSDSGSHRRKPFFVLGCERGGVYKCTKKKLKREDTGSRKCECPFRLRGYFLASQEWSLSVVCEKHNHPLESKLEGHLLAGRLNEEQKVIVAEMTRNMVPPKNILLTLKDRCPENQTVIKQVYNARDQLKKCVRDARSEIQHLFKCLDEHGYVYKHRTVGESKTVNDIFWAHPDSIKLFKTFPNVLLMDSTYKTNQHKMPLLEIVGVTSTDMTFGVGFAFMSSEKEDNFTWVLQSFVDILNCKNNMPKVIVTDRDTALMNAVANIFPSSTALVCRYHISKNVRARCKLYCKGTTVQSKDGNVEEVKHMDLVNAIMDAWEYVVEASSEELYVEAVERFRKVCDKSPNFLKYVENTILDPLKEKIVRAWTDRVLHFGNTTTNRVESTHGRLKKYLTDGKGDLARGWEAMHHMLKLMFTEIQASFGRSLTVSEHRYNNNVLYSLLMFQVSRTALNYIHYEEKRSKECGMDRIKCGCVIRTTYGLPCACLIAKKTKNNLPIRLDEVNIHWRKLRMDDYNEGVEETDEDFSCLTEWKAIQERLKRVDYNMKCEIRQQIREIAWPETTMLTSPVAKLRTKGAGKKRLKSTPRESSSTREPSYWEHVDRQFPDTQDSVTNSMGSKRKGARIGKVSRHPVPRPNIPFIDEMPIFMYPHIAKIANVKGDGNCGFRVVAEHLGKGEDNYNLIRLNLIRELNRHKEDYLPIFGADRLEYLKTALYPSETKTGFAPEEKWLTFPDMGHIIATAYNRVVVELTKHQNGFSETFFPLRGHPPPNPSQRIMCIGYLPGHFVHVHLKEGCPIPPTSPQWKQYKQLHAETWEDHFVEKQCLFEELMTIERGAEVVTRSSLGSCNIVVDV